MNEKTLVFYVVAIALNAFVSCTFTSRNEVAPPLVEDDGGYDLSSVFGEGAVFYVEEVATAPDIKDAFIAEASRSDPTLARERVEQVLTQLQDEARDHLYLDATRAGLLQLTDRERARVHTSFKIDTLSVVPMGEANSRGFIKDTFGKLTTSSITSSARFVCTGTLSLSKNGTVLAQHRGKGQDVWELAKSESGRATATGGAEVDGDNAKEQAFSLNGPTKEAVRQSINSAWREMWRGYLDKLERSKQKANTIPAQSPR